MHASKSRLVGCVMGLLLASGSLICGTGCGPSPKPQTPSQPAVPAAEASVGDAPAPASEVAPAATPNPAVANPDGPHISRSVGDSGGALVFWPRVIPRTAPPEVTKLAGDLQARLTTVVQRALPGRSVDIRPEPERVCPRGGCEAVNVGVLLVHDGGGCGAVALVSRPGESPQKLVTWGGTITLKTPEVPFREYPESQVTINDMVPCNQLLEKLAAAEADVAKAIEEAAD